MTAPDTGPLGMGRLVMNPLFPRVQRYMEQYAQGIHTCNPDCIKPQHLIRELADALTASEQRVAELEAELARKLAYIKAVDAAFERRGAR